MPKSPDLPSSISGTLTWALAWVAAAALVRIGWEVGGWLWNKI